MGLLMPRKYASATLAAPMYIPPRGNIAASGESGDGKSRGIEVCFPRLDVVTVVLVSARIGALIAVDANLGAGVRRQEFVDQPT